MISILTNLAFGVFLFLAAIALIPRLLEGDKTVYEIAVPFAAILIISVILINNLNLSLIIATGVSLVIYYLRSEIKK